MDMGAKYSPIFGRYGFVGEGGEGLVVRVGDEVKVGEKNGVGSTFCKYCFLGLEWRGTEMRYV